MSTFEERRQAIEKAELKRQYAFAVKNDRLERFRARLIEKEIRKRYSVSDELAVQRKRDKNPEEFAEYDTFVENVKAKVNVLIYTLGE